MNQIKLLYIRDMKKCINKRTILIWIVMSILCVFFFFNSNGKHEFVTTNTIDFMSVMLPQVIFGAWAAMSVDFDLISADRENSVLDCILSSGITKNQIFVSKALTTASLCFIGALIYLIPVSCSIVYLGGGIEYLAVIINYLFSAMGVCSGICFMGIFDFYYSKVIKECSYLEFGLRIGIDATFL
ncbi:hypothetical protein BM532_06870 [Clostridioides difficile]|nr:hypothetical protein BM532_06870 [Clostridioides difficile]